MAAVHAANVYMRCTADLLMLNSACGQPLRLLGAWQWFDSILFHGMLDAARRGGAGASWRAQLRGDLRAERRVQRGEYLVTTRCRGDTGEIYGKFRGDIREI